MHCAENKLSLTDAGEAASAIGAVAHALAVGAIAGQLPLATCSCKVCVRWIGGS